MLCKAVRVGRGHDGSGGIRASGLVVRRATVKGRSNAADQLRGALQMKISHLGILPASVRLVSWIRLLGGCASAVTHRTAGGVVLHANMNSTNSPTVRIRVSRVEPAVVGIVPPMASTISSTRS